MKLTHIRLKKGEDRRIRAGHPWVFSNEIDTKLTPLKQFSVGEQIGVEAHDGSFLGVAYINPHSLISARIFSKNPTERLTEDFFAAQFERALQLRSSVFSVPFYRLVFAESDHLPGLIIDRFDHDFVMQINTAGLEPHIDTIIAALKRIVPTLNSVLLRNDSQIREQEGLPTYVKAGLGAPPQEIVVRENNASFYAPLWDGQKTGWFYDHRPNRAQLQLYVKNKRVLDVFSYLGGWGIPAALFGAKEVTCIDASALACGLIERNAKLNAVEDKVRAYCEDAFDALKQLLKEKQSFDVIILDPPAFVKRFKDHKEGLLAYQRLNEMAVNLLVPNGILFSCSCSMHVSIDDLMQMLKRVAYRTNTQLQVLQRGHQGIDHPIHLAVPETDYLKAIVVRKLA